MTTDLKLAELGKRMDYASLGKIQRLTKRPLREFHGAMAKIFFRSKSTVKVVDTFFGYKMGIPFPGAMGLYLFGYTESELTEYMIKHVHEGMAVVDIGANIGYYTLLLSSLVGARGEVHAFEPAKEAFSLLGESVERNRNFHPSQEVRLNHCGLYSSAGTMAFKDYGLSHSGLNTLYEARSGSKLSQPLMTSSSLLSTATGRNDAEKESTLSKSTRKAPNMRSSRA
jgi:FkbM family methyltransferase